METVQFGGFREWSNGAHRARAGRPVLLVSVSGLASCYALASVDGDFDRTLGQDKAAPVAGKFAPPPRKSGAYLLGWSGHGIVFDLGAFGFFLILSPHCQVFMSTCSDMTYV
ncbi:uncharacterized protein EI90DRAFT_3047776 [Cantharellus anzutake]|uniref:uncharacterized protein n=1 Tax=Cantharellus anzutake TaxID=1750568 RepID=UPI001904145C|nr:uncharacterized protein EI90DRAFT_3085074 [Cantharellus anzutake]XP_038919045.1 uncharacterized protein EI90DRAFT_3047776 [Cantharellus anzutake]KAF8317537.1 hypothetical protein EI90DRAFT_3085074 [Cantharellus anzutake]KAF8335992.1 hypothetical protein EI90DRAFT_3047776 [Cantharellus anzutake]